MRQILSNDWGVAQTERLVKQRLAIANLYSPLLTAYRKDDIGADTLRSLTLATKRQQKSWWALFTSDDEHAPQGRNLKAWLFGGRDIPVSNALFDVEAYGGNIVSDLFGEERYFDDAAQFWTLQNTAIAEAKERYLAEGWVDVIVGDIGAYWHSWEYCAATKAKGGRVYFSVSNDGEVTFREGFITDKEAQKCEKANANGGADTDTKPLRPELTKAMQNYLDLHRHACVREKLLSKPEIALRLAVAQIIASSTLWSVTADPQKANADSIKASLSTNQADLRFAEERATIAALLDVSIEDDANLVPAKGEWSHSFCAYAIFGKLCKVDDEVVMRILTFVVAETLTCGSGFVEGLGVKLSVDTSEDWKPDETFLDLLRDKEAINACLKDVAGKNTADAHIASTAKVQKKIIADCLDGTRANAKRDWQPRYAAFPMKTYTKRVAIDAIERQNAVKKHFA